MWNPNQLRRRRRRNRNRNRKGAGKSIIKEKRDTKKKANLF